MVLPTSSAKFPDINKNMQRVYSMSGSSLHVFIKNNFLKVFTFTLQSCGYVLYGSPQDSQSKQGGYSMHQLQGNKEFGSEKKGYLLKKSDG